MGGTTAKASLIRDGIYQTTPEYEVGGKASGSRAMHETAILNLANRLYGGAVTDTAGACRLTAGETVEVWMVEGSVPLRFTYQNAARLYREL